MQAVERQHVAGGKQYSGAAAHGHRPGVTLPTYCRLICAPAACVVADDWFASMPTGVPATAGRSVTEPMLFYAERITLLPLTLVVWASVSRLWPCA